MAKDQQDEIPAPGVDDGPALRNAPSQDEHVMVEATSRYHVSDHQIESSSRGPATLFGILHSEQDGAYSGNPVQRPAQPQNVDSDLSSPQQPNTPTDSEEILTRIPKPEYPFRVYDGPPVSITEEAQRRIFRWRSIYWETAFYGAWLTEPDLEKLKEVTLPYLQRLVPDAPNFKIEFLTEGGFNKVYTAKTVSMEPEQAFIIRVPFPADPYYKTESDVATTELIRCSTSIPVPRIYAYDSSTNNKLGFEWMIVEKVKGKVLYETWKEWDYEAKLRFSQLMALWTKQILQITSKRIGSIYLRSEGQDLEFFMGRLACSFVTGNRRLWYDVARGPFRSLEEYFGAYLAIYKAEAEDQLQRALKEERRVDESVVSAGEADGPRLTAEEALYVQADKDDAEHYNWEGITPTGFEVRIEKCVCFEEALDQLCDWAAGEMPEFSTSLRHPDISASNIFIDDTGNPIALIDWEHAELKPLACATPYPRFLDKPSREEEPEDSAEDSCWESRRARGGTHGVEFQMAASRRRYLDELNEYHCTKLRPEFKRELERLMPSLDANAWPGSNSFLRQLKDHIHDMRVDDYDYIEWLKKHVVYSDESSEDEGQEDGQEAAKHDDESI